jgi:hypothetical protein
MSIPTKIYTPSISAALTQFEKDIDEYADRYKETIYIVAGNQSEFDNYVHNKHAEDVDNYNKKYIYVRDRYTLMDLTHITGYYIGTAFQRKDINQIKQAVAYIKQRMKLLETS